MPSKLEQQFSRVRQRLDGRFRDGLSDVLRGCTQEELVEQLVAVCADVGFEQRVFRAIEVAQAVRQPDQARRLQAVSDEIDAEFRAELKKELMSWSHAELLDQLVDMHSYVDHDESMAQVDNAQRELAARICRLKERQIDVTAVKDFVGRVQSLRRSNLVANGLLHELPMAGAATISPAHRTQSGSALLEEAKDLLHGLLYGRSEDGILLDRGDAEILNIMVPTHKADVFNFLQAASRVGVDGTWIDPTGEANDFGANNLLLQVLFSDSDDDKKGEVIGKGVDHCLHVINLLEVNEQKLCRYSIQLEAHSLDLGEDDD
jgi:hypothetical protein